MAILPFAFLYRKAVSLVGMVVMSRLVWMLYFVRLFLIFFMSVWTQWPHMNELIPKLWYSSAIIVSRGMPCFSSVSLVMPVILLVMEST